MLKILSFINIGAERNLNPKFPKIFIYLSDSWCRSSQYIFIEQLHVSWKSATRNPNFIYGRLLNISLILYIHIYIFLLKKRRVRKLVLKMFRKNRYNEIDTFNKERNMLRLRFSHCSTRVEFNIDLHTIRANLCELSESRKKECSTFLIGVSKIYPYTVKQLLK